jgi:hypothetical protein
MLLLLLYSRTVRSAVSPHGGSIQATAAGKRPCASCVVLCQRNCSRAGLGWQHRDWWLVWAGPARPGQLAGRRLLFETDATSSSSDSWTRTRPSNRSPNGARAISMANGWLLLGTRLRASPTGGKVAHSGQLSDRIRDSKLGQMIRQRNQLPIIGASTLERPNQGQTAAARRQHANLSGATGSRKSCRSTRTRSHCWGCLLLGLCLKRCWAALASADSRSRRADHSLACCHPLHHGLPPPSPSGRSSCNILANHLRSDNVANE